MSNNYFKLFSLIFLVTFLFSNIFFIVPALADNVWQWPTLEIPFPAQIFSQANCSYGDNGQLTSCSTPWIGEYIAAIYKYLIGIVGIIAVLVMMLGGVVWMTAGGSASRIGEAKSWISASLTGLILVLSSYTILYYINPQLVSLKAITIQAVQEIEGDNNGRQITAADISSDISTVGIKPGPIQGVVGQMIGKYTYSQTQRLTTVNGVNYIDCSSFACTVLTAAGINTPPPSQCSTANLFNGKSPQNINLNNVPAGFLVGFPPSASNNGNGHVYVSLGNGQFAQAHGGSSGRTPGNAINIVSANDVNSVLNKYGVAGSYIYP